MGVVLAPWEEQSSSLSQRTGGVTKNKVQSGTAASRTAQLICTVESGERSLKDCKDRRGVEVAEFGGISLPRPTDVQLRILKDPQLRILN